MKLDRTDQAILAELQRDGRISNRDLAEQGAPERIGVPAARARARAGRA